MIVGEAGVHSYETMPQTVPSGAWSPPSDYSCLFAAESFDLSLLNPPVSPQGPLSFYDPTQEQVKSEPLSSILFQTNLPYQQSYSPLPSPQEPAYLQVKQESPPPPPPPAPAIDQTKCFLDQLDQSYVQDEYKKKDTIIRSLLEGSDPCKNENDHKLLREFLRDTSFQKKYNLIPISVGELGTGYRGMEEECVDLASQAAIEPMLSLAMEQLKKEVHSTCAVLGISRDPSKWTAEEVGTWLAWNSAQYNIPSGALHYFNMPGAQLTALTEQDFQQRAPQCGSLLHAQLEIWKAASVEETTVDVSGFLQETTTQSSSSSGEPSEDEDDEEMGEFSQSASASPKSSCSRSSGGGGGSGSGSGTGGSHIHLWQFLKELLSSPQQYGSCIRWVDRPNGVFKIEDSVRVAKLWGRRKNRPAMNYDKLSRSIRQYYKKGIMKKTERSQRLVYQFCHPYNL